MLAPERTIMLTIILSCGIILSINQVVTIQLIFKFGFIGEFGLQLSGGKGGHSPPLPKRVAGGVGGGRRNTSVYKNPKYLVAAYKCR